MTAPNKPLENSLQARLHDFEISQSRYILSLLRLGVRFHHKVDQKATVIILNYKRKENIEARNAADNAIYTAEKALDDYQNTIPFSNRELAQIQEEVDVQCRQFNF